MINLFKKFADYINGFRIAQCIDFKKYLYEILDNKKGESLKILEVGCNNRPLIDKKRYNNIYLCGLDPDSSIDKVDLVEKNVVDEFDICDFESYQSNHNFDLIVMDMVFEHIENNKITLDKVKSLLNANGVFISHHPSDFHPYSIINRLLTHKTKIFVLKLLRPWSEVGVITGWKSYYSKCNIISLKRICRKKQLEIFSTKFNWNASDYFAFLPPLFILIVLYEEICKLLRFQSLCASYVVQIRHQNYDSSV